MNFLSLQSLLIASALAIPALLLLYFLKLRRQERKISSTLLWKKAVQDLQVNAPFQKLRKNLLLFLQLLILAAVLFSLGNPVANMTKTSERNIVLLIDRSGSMKTIEEDGQTRLDLAKNTAIDFVQGLKGDAKAMVIGFADRADVICSFTDDVRRLVRRIEGIEPTDGPSLIGEALQLAVAYSTKIATGGEGWAPGSVETADIELFSDGRIADAAEEYVTRGKMTYYRTGLAADNAGIVTFDVRRELEQPGVVSVFAQIQNFGPGPITSDVSLELDGRMLSVQEVNLGPASLATTRPTDLSLAENPDALPSSQNVIFKLPNEAGGVVGVKLHREDALALDNLVTAPIDPPRAIRVLAVSDRSKILFWLKRAFVTSMEIEDYTEMSTSEYEKADTADLSVEGRSAFDLIVLDNHDTDRLWPGNYIFFGGLPKIEGIERGENVDEQYFVNWRESHPLLRYVPLDEKVYVIKWKRLKLPDHALKLVEGQDSTVMAFISDPGHRYVISAFDLMESNFRWQPAFFIFLQNAVMYLATGGLTDTGRLVAPGDTITLPVPPGAEEATIRRPDGSTDEIDVKNRTTATYAKTRQCGLYKATFDDAKDTTESYAVNILDPTESLIAPNNQFTIGADEVKTVTGEIKANRPLWPYAVGIALVFLIFEWWVYNRRVMI
ncbi:MAG: VWA domain-containing protein [Phycisphaerales bacterium]|nr:VWA domain-containing protein [Phycisphaerales bacterium]